jgi:hypothetical protein
MHATVFRLGKLLRKEFDYLRESVPLRGRVEVYEIPFRSTIRNVINVIDADQRASITGDKYPNSFFIEACRWIPSAPCAGIGNSECLGLLQFH